MPVWTSYFFCFCYHFFIIWRFFVLSPCSRGKLAICVCCSERTPRFYSLSSFMVPICTILKVLILVYMQNIPVLQQKHVKKIRLKKCYSITLIFSEHCTVALLCASISEAKKNFEINALFIKWYRVGVNFVFALGSTLLSLLWKRISWNSGSHMVSLGSIHGKYYSIN